MLYFSELKGKTVKTEDGNKLGKLSDLIFVVAEHPVITKLIVKGPKNHVYIIPVSFIKKINSVILVTKGFEVVAITENEMYVDKNILDQQIIDINGNKIVRVNDVALQDKPQLMIAGVDIGIIGILRWFGIEETFGRLLRLLGTTVTSRFLSWADIQPLQLARGQVVLKKGQKKLARLRPEDLADHLENMSVRNVSRVLDLMDDKLAAKVTESLHITYQQNLFKQFTPDRSAKLITHMDPDEAVDILLALSAVRRENILSKVTQNKREELTSLLSLSRTAIGGLITTSRYITASPEETAAAIKARIQKETQDFDTLWYVYAINKDQQLVGVANMHELLLQKSDAPFYKFMNPSLIVTHLTTPLEIATKRMLKYSVEALPVIDDKKKLLGIVTIDDVGSWLLEKIK